MSEWIDAKWQLPDDGVIVLVATTSDSDPVWLGSYDYETAQWYTPENTQFQATVTHWAEMPERPLPI